MVTQEPTHINEIASRLEKIQPDEICTIVYTSGTTGEPKGAELAHRNLVDMSRAILKVFHWALTTRPFRFFPIRMSSSASTESSSASRSAVRPGFRRGTDHLASELGEVKPTVMNSVPRVLREDARCGHGESPRVAAIRRLIFKWAIAVGTRFAHEPNPGPRSDGSTSLPTAWCSQPFANG